ncbi:MAG TPA: acetyltransferase [Kaistia sp.]|nr:acetyltransferase [Kaistia sp.]
MALRITPAAAEDKAQLRSLLADCLSELACYGEVDLAYPYLDAYWDPRERRWPYLLRQGEAICGFALVNAWSPSGKGTDFAMAEFYITPAARRNGSGLDAALKVFRMHPGTWELGIMSRNEPAQRFWPKAIAEAGARTVERIEVADETIYRFSIG